MKLGQNVYFNDRVIKLASSHGHQTRFRLNENLNIPSISLSKVFKSFLYNSVKLWNELPLAAKNLPSLSSFKHNFRTSHFVC